MLQENVLPQRRKGAKKTFSSAAALCAFASLRENFLVQQLAMLSSVNGRRTDDSRPSFMLVEGFNYGMTPPPPPVPVQLIGTRILYVLTCPSAL